MKLNVHLNTINIIEMQYANPCDRLLRILYYRLNQLPRLTWHDIVRALRSPLLQQHDLASTIESQYITASQSPASVSQHAEPHPLSPHSDIPQPKRPRYDIPESQFIENAPPIVPHLCYGYIEQFIEYVRDIYKRSEVGNPRDTKWPPFASKCFINLAIIDRKTVSFEKAHEYTKAMVQNGDVDVILKEKRSIDFMDIAKDIPNNRIIVVEGAPGVGKSTFAWEFCRRWERGEIAQQYQLVLLLRLRDERMSTAKSLDDFISYPASASVCQAVVQKFKSTLGKNILMILEGFDELPDLCRDKSSIFMQLINGDILPNATILITSRPWATAAIHANNYDRIFQYIEILGFTQPQIEEYIESVFNDKDKGLNEAATQNKTEIMTYIKQYPQIKACMYIPLNSVIVVSVYQENKAGRCILPKTLTGLYYALTQTLLLRYLKGHPEYGRRKWIIKSLDRHLPAEVHKHLLDVSAIAYRGICSGKSSNVELIFHDLPSDLQTLGLMQSVPQLYVTEGEGMSHNFLHLTVQEFLAALHISFMSPAEQLQHLQRHEDGRLRVVLRFLAGLTKLDNIPTDALKDLLGKPDKKNYYEPQNKYCTYLTPDVAVSTHQVNWMFESQNSNMVISILESKCVEFVFDKYNNMLPLEFYSLGYCIAHSQCKWVLVLNKEIGKDEVDMLSSGFLKEEKTGNFTAALRFRQIPNTCMDFVCSQWNKFLSTPELYMTVTQEIKINSSSFSNLEVLHLQLGSGLTITIEGFSHLEYLQSLTISSMDRESSLSHNSSLCIKELLLSSKCLKCLHLNNKPYRWNIKPQDMESLTKAMTENQSLPLKGLVLGCHCNFTESAAGNLAKFVQHSPSLENFRFVKFTFPASQLLELIKAIHLNPNLQVWELVKPTVTGNVQNFTDFIRGMAQYPKINLNNFTFTPCQHNASELLDLLKFNVSREMSWPKLKCGTNTCIVSSVADVDAYVQIWSQFSKETSNTRFLFRDIRDEGVSKIATVLNTRPGLKRLDLSNNNISNAGATALAQALRHNSSLEELDLSGNDGIGEEGTRQLVQALAVNTYINATWRKTGGLWLPKRCKEYATQCTEYNAVKHRIGFQ